MKIELEGKIYDLDIDQAKKLNLLKEDARCKSWEDFKKIHKNTDGYVCNTNGECFSCIEIQTTGQQFTKSDAKAIWALSYLMKLRRDWVGDWEPDWCTIEPKYCIITISNCLTIACFRSDHRAFSFPTKGMAIEFLNCFRDLFEQCKNYI